MNNEDIYDAELHFKNDNGKLSGHMKLIDRDDDEFSYTEKIINIEISSKYELKFDTVDDGVTTKAKGKLSLDYTKITDLKIWNYTNTGSVFIKK